MSDQDNAIINMDAVDSLSRPMRALVYEYGLKIVAAMYNDGYTNPFELAGLLETWRCRRQEEWLATNYVTRKSANSIADAIQYRMSSRQCHSTSPRTA